MWLGLETAACRGAISDAIQWAERIMDEIDRHHLTNSVPQQTSSLRE
jgi:hypothetical protein